MEHAADARYSRQERFTALGPEGQRRIGESRVVVVGCGALGSAQAELLARAGAGHLRIIDRDYVELSNLQRQFLFDESDAADGLPKAVAAARRLRAVNSAVQVEPVVADLTPRNADDLLGDADLILDGTDNFETRYLVNDFAVSRGIPWIYGAAVGSYGIKMAIVPGRTACFRCVYPEPPAGVQPTCETAGVLGPVTAAVAALEAADALKILSGHIGEISGAIITMDLWCEQVRQVRAPAKDADCPCCGQRRFEYLDGRRRAPISLCGRNAVQIHERTRPVDLGQLARQLAPVGEVRFNEFALRAAVGGFEMTVFPDGRAIIKGTTDIGIARSLYAKYVGA
jgi:molybdopterin/thiamine biosynthesis adenylyltransferase